MTEVNHEFEAEKLEYQRHIAEPPSPKHTPGPWTACFGTFNGHITHFHIAGRPDGSCKPVADCDNDFTGGLGKWSGAELQANARLIAAAPELLEALEEITKAFAGGYITTHPTRLDKARAAIAKATGQLATAA